MVKISTLLISAALCLAACKNMPEIDVKYDYPSQSKAAHIPVSSAKPKQEASISPIVMNDAVEEKGTTESFVSMFFAPTTEAAPEAVPEMSFIWPINDADKYLSGYKSGQSANAVASKDGKTLEFKVLSEYVSAADEQCKKYIAGEFVHLACFNKSWYPVRSFEE